MRDLNALNKYRVPHHELADDKHNGSFLLKIDGNHYKVIASNGGGWEHVSISGKKKPPSWKVMEFVKEMFFEDREVVMQLHVARKDYVNCHPNCLHLWRPIDEVIPTPPLEFV